ncbi:MAG: tetratricopeptide repeat protein [Myxococcaceae bacterium]
MDDAELERVRRKVEAGEALSEAELGLLERAARGGGGPGLRLSVAHALMNAGDDREALTLLEAMQRDFPREVQVWLAHARALVGIERYAEAERSVQQALRVNPGDPEALKVLAVVALRRGELSRARAYVEEVLRVDPIDEEAQLLMGELDASYEDATPATPGQLPKVLRPEFIQALVAQLEAQSTPHLLQRDQLVVRLGKGGVARLDLKSLYSGYLDEGRALEPTVEAIARELAERSLGVPEGREAVLGRVMPVLRHASFLDTARGAASREGPAGLLVFYVLDDSALVRYLPEGTLQSHQVTLEEVDTAAWKNLEERPTTPRPVAVEGGTLRLTPEPTGLWALCASDGHDAARLLCPAQGPELGKVVGPGPYRVFLGARELTVLCREDDPGAVARLHLLSAAADGIPGAFRLESAGRLVAL